MKRFAVVLSGEGTNLQAILEALRAGRLAGELAVVLSNRPGARGLERARRAGIPAEAIDHRAFSSRAAFDAELTRRLERHAVELVVLAGFMRVLTPGFVRSWADRILNLHPALLPAFPGLDAQAQALRAGVKISGCTVHFADEGVDTGPIIAQRAVAVLPNDTVESLSKRIHLQEHALYPLVIDRVLRGQVCVESTPGPTGGRLVHIAGGPL